MSVIRTFVGIPVPPEIVEHIDRASVELDRAVPGFYRWSHKRGLHLTLYFLGDLETAATEQAQAALSGISVAHFKTLTSGLVVLPERTVPKVLAIGIEASPALARLQQSVHDRCFPLAAYKETRRFLPHVTFGRIKRDKPTRAKALKQALAGLRMPSMSWEVTEFFLYSSRLEPSGAVHEVLGAYLLI